MSESAKKASAGWGMLGGVSLIVVGLTQPYYSTTYFLLLILVVLVPAARLIQLAGRAEPLDILDPYLFIPLTVGITYVSGPALLSGEGRSEDAAAVTVALLLGMCGYYLGVVAALPGTRSRSKSASPRPLVSRGQVLLCFGIGALAMAVFWLQAGGLPLLAADVENARVEALTGAGIPFYLSFLMMVAAWWAVESPKISSKTAWSLVAIGALLLATSGWRNTPFALVAVAGILTHYDRGFRTKTLFAGTVAMIAAVVGLGIYRVVASQLTSYETYRLSEEGKYFQASLAYFQNYAATFSRNLADILQLPAMGWKPLYGESFAWNFLALLPGSTREPFDFVLKRATGAGFEGGGLPPTIFGEWVLNFGEIGLFLGMIAVGVVAKYAHDNVRHNVGLPRLLGTVVAFYLFVAVRGGLGNVLFTTAVLTASICALAAYSRIGQSSKPKRFAV